jgi:hypothetical protein
VWALGFDSDPTQIDRDGDGVLDWVVRGGGAFPSAELRGGVWSSPSQTVLDSRPMDDFASRTVVDVRMRSVGVPTSAYGAVFWINLNEGGSAFSALFVNVSLQAGGGQTLSLYGKKGNTEASLASFPDLPETMMDIHLDIDPGALTVALSANGAPLGRYAIPVTGAPNADHFATLLAWSGSAEFDSVRMERCPP